MKTSWRTLLFVLAAACCGLALPACHHRAAVSPELADRDQVRSNAAKLEELLARAKASELACPARCDLAHEGCELARNSCDLAGAHHAELQQSCAQAQEACASLNSGCARCSAGAAPATIPGR